MSEPMIVARSVRRFGLAAWILVRTTFQKKTARAGGKVFQILSMYSIIRSAHASVPMGPEFRVMW